MHAFEGDSINKTDSKTVNYYRNPDNTYIMSEYTKFNTMQEVVTEYVSMVRFKTYGDRHYITFFRVEKGYDKENILLMIDGIPIINHDILYNYNPANIEKMEVFFDKFVVGDNIFDGVFSVTTKNNNLLGLVPDKGTNIYKYDSPQLKKLFYSPKSDKSKPDYRHTLYWNAHFNAKHPISFYTSDIEGKYTIIIEGITENGDVIYGKTQINVQ